MIQDDRLRGTYMKLQFLGIRYFWGTGSDSHLVECDSLLSLHFQNLLAFERQLLWFLVVVNLSIISVSTGVGNTKALARGQRKPTDLNQYTSFHKGSLSKVQQLLPIKWAFIKT